MSQQCVQAFFLILAIAVIIPMLFVPTLSLILKAFLVSFIVVTTILLGMTVRSCLQRYFGRQ